MEDQIKIMDLNDKATMVVDQEEEEEGTMVHHRIITIPTVEEEIIIHRVVAESNVRLRKNESLISHRIVSSRSNVCFIYHENSWCTIRSR